MKTIFTLLLSSITIFSFGQAKTAHISIHGGGSATFGDYAYTGWSDDAYNDYLYPFIGGGADGGFNFGFNTTYYFTKNIGLNVGYMMSVHGVDPFSRARHFENYWGSLFDRYVYDLDVYLHGTGFIGSKFSLPLMDDKLFLDLGANIGLDSYSFPINEEDVYFIDGSKDSWVSGGQKFSNLATKYDLSVRYFFGNFGLGAEASLVTSYSSGDQMRATNAFYNAFDATITTRESIYTPFYDNSFLNYNLSISYRVGNK